MTASPSLEKRESLRRYTAGFVTADDILEFTGPNDPGLGQSRYLLSELLASGETPDWQSVDLDALGYILWEDKGKDESMPATDAARMRRYRCYLLALALVIHEELGSFGGLPALNVMAIQLLEDARQLQDDALLNLTLAALNEVHESMGTMSWDAEKPFLTLALIVGEGMLETGAQSASAQSAGARAQNAGTEDVAAWVERLVAEEALTHDQRAREDFLWGATFFNDKIGLWKLYVDRYVKPTDEARRELRERLLGGGGL